MSIGNFLFLDILPSFFIKIFIDIFLVMI